MGAKPYCIHYQIRYNGDGLYPPPLHFLFDYASFFCIFFIFFFELTSF